MWNDFPIILAQEGGDTGSLPPKTNGIEAGEGGGEAGTLTPGGSGDTNNPGGDTTGEASPFNPMFFMILALGLLFIIMMGGGRKEKKKRAAMLAAMSKGDKVQTIGGILGTVVEMKDTEVVIKVDENANTRLRFAKSAIQSVVETPDE